MHLAPSTAGEGAVGIRPAARRGSTHGGLGRGDRRGSHPPLSPAPPPPRLDWLPAIVLTSKLCPIGVESTVYALLAGFQNFGQSLSSSLGVLALDEGGIQTPDDALCDLSNLTLLIIIGHIVLPLLTIPLTFWLIPNAKMTDDLVGGLPMMGEAEKDDSDGSDAGSNSSNCNGEAGGGTDATGVEGRGGPLAPAEDVPPLVAPVSVSAPVAADGAAQERDQEPAQGSSGPFRRGRGIRANRFERPLALIASSRVPQCFPMNRGFLTRADDLGTVVSVAIRLTPVFHK